MNQTATAWWNSLSIKEKKIHAALLKTPVNKVSLKQLKALHREYLLQQIMRLDQELGLYDSEPSQEEEEE